MIVDTPTGGPPATPHRVAVLGHDDVGAFEVALAVQVFAAANDHAGAPLYEVAVAGPERPVVTRTGLALSFALVPDRPLSWAEAAHTVIVPAFVEHLDPPAELVTTIRRAHRAGARIVSLCLGSFFVAATGLLDGRTATTHWHWTEELVARYPRVRVDPDRLFVEDRGIFSSGGGTAGLDLVLALVERDHGRALAERIARFMVAPLRRDGDHPQYTPRSVPRRSRTLHDTQRWAEEHLEDGATVSDLARHAGMSTRTFTRRFRDTVGTSPMEWLQRTRVRRAQELLQGTTWTIARIAVVCGFGSEATLRYHFGRIAAVSPGRYRRLFGPIGVEGRNSPVA